MRYCVSLLILIASCWSVTANPAPNYFSATPDNSKFAADRPIIDGTKFDDVHQTYAPTCALLSALSAAALRDFDFKSKIRHLGGDRYSVSLFQDGKWRDIEVAFAGWTQHDPAPVPRDSGEFWPALYQRAYLRAWNVDCSSANPYDWVMVIEGKRSDPKKDPQLWERSHHAMTMITGKHAEERELPTGETQRNLDWLGSQWGKGHLLVLRADNPDLVRRHSQHTPNTDRFRLLGKYLHDSQGGGWDNTEDFAVGPEGTLYVLKTDGLFQQKPNGKVWSDIAKGVSKFAVGSNGLCCYSKGEFLHDLAGGGWEKTKDFSIGPDGMLYVLKTDGLFQRAPNGRGWSDIAKGVRKFAVGSNGECLYLVGERLHHLRGGGWDRTKDFSFGWDNVLYIIDIHNKEQEFEWGRDWKPLQSKPEVGHAFTVVGIGPDWVDVRNPWAKDGKKEADSRKGIIRIRRDRLSLFTHAHAGHP